MVITNVNADTVHPAGAQHRHARFSTVFDAVSSSERVEVVQAALSGPVDELRPTYLTPT
jgi:hypothetical protein